MSIRTLLIGLDGATFDVIDPLVRAGVMPFLGSLLESGVRAPLRTVVPALTPPAWTSLMTGRTPGQHGVFDFFRWESLDSRYIRFFTSHDVQCPTIWSMAAAKGLRVTSLNFPSMFPPPRIPGAIVPGWVPWKQLRLACWPEDLFDRLKAIPGFNARELAMDIKLEERATEGCSDRKEFEPWIKLHIRREQNWLRVARYLACTDPAELTAVLLDGVDKLQHLCWRFLCPETAAPLKEDWEFRVRDLCLEYFRTLDGILAELNEIAGPEANVVLASDHGFGPTWEVFHVNAWLASKGYLAWAAMASENGHSQASLGVGQVARHTWMIDWSRTVAFAATPTSNGIHIVKKRDGEPCGVAAEDYAALRRQLIDELLSVRDPESGEPVVEHVWTREEVYPGPHEQFGPDLTLTLRDGGLVSILPSREFLRKRSEVAGAHRPAGIFAARGPAIRKGIRSSALSILDVAPMVTYLSGLPLHESFQGRLPVELIRRQWLENAPPQRSGYEEARIHAAGAAGGDRAAGDANGESDDQAILDGMRELGYIE